MPASRSQLIPGGMQLDSSDIEDGYERPASSDSVPDDEFVKDADRFSKALDSVSIARKTPSERRTDVFRLVDTYYQYASDKVRDLRQSQRQASSTALRRLDDASSQDSMDLDEPDTNDQSTIPPGSLQYWEEEAQVWDMLRRLLPLRYANRNTIKPIRREISQFESSSDLWDEFLQSDLIAQERKAVLECLQTSADESRTDIDEMVRDYQQKAERGDIVAYGWLHTRSAIKMQKNVNGWSGALDPNSSDAGQMLMEANGTSPLVTQLDPDVATRQGRKLQPQDEYFERAIWLGCYELLRRGRSLAEIRDWCIERTEVWRAVSMSAMPLSKSHDAERSASNTLSTVLWRRTCFTLARQGGIDDHERAVYGILSGDISSVEKVCKNWDDFVFAHYNALLRAQFDSYMTKRSSPEAITAIQQSFPTFNALQFHGDATSAGERLVNLLETNPKTAAEAKTPMKALQAAIISNNLKEYMSDLGAALGKRANAKAESALIPRVANAKGTASDQGFFELNDHRGMRVAAHVCLLISSLDELQGGARDDFERVPAQENIVAAYVSTLRLHNHIDLMPLYCSKLHRERAFFTLSRNIRGVTQPKARERLLRNMEKLGIDIAKFVTFQPRSLFEQYPDVEDPPPAFGRLVILSNDPPTLKYGRPLKPDFFGDEPDELDAVDEALIQSLEWFLLVDGLWDEVFQAGTAIYKRFLKNFNLYAAKSLSERIRCSEIFKRKAGIAVSDDDDVSWFEEIRLGVMNGTFEDNGLTPDDMAVARNFFEMECLVRTLESMETIASGRARQSEADMEHSPTETVDKDFWNQIINDVKLVKSFIRPVLSNWLLESIEEDEDFGYLRDAYLPETIIGYVSVLHFAGTSMSRDNLLECMELASIIAKKDADVAAVLMKADRMKDIVDGFANCSKALAISSNAGKGGGSSSKKMREMGWTRELWSVRR
ncbi:nuclear pore protein 84/107 [Xylariaceae sp. FL0804]|nr:nuclear pore protein 84/107 [Xylariaceae sp. FL0804]